MQQAQFDVAVIGGGIVGLACAYAICESGSAGTVAVIEKEDRLAFHQTGHNSGVVHSGLYYQPGSIKARTCARGRQLLLGFAQKHSIRYRICGKLVVATGERQIPQLEQVQKNGIANGLAGLERIGASRIKEIEPFCGGIEALYVPQTGVIDFVAVAEKLADVMRRKPGNQILTGHSVSGFKANGSKTFILTDKHRISARYIINCAGLQSDRIARLAKLKCDVRIIPFRGDYLELYKGAERIKGLIYPVPDLAFPFLGVHVTRSIDGQVECGPSAVFSFKREGYSKTAFSLRDSFDSLSFFGTWRLFLRHWRFGLGEYTRAFCRRLMVRQLRRLVPSISVDQLRPGKSGIRAQALDRKGNLVDDFRVRTRDNMIHVLNAPSPAATACLAIGDSVRQITGEYFNFKV